MRQSCAGEKIIDTVDFSLEPQFNQDDSNDEKVEALAKIICRAGDEAAAALFVLMERWRTAIPNYSRTQRNTLPSLTALTRIFLEWLTLSSQ